MVLSKELKEAVTVDQLQHVRSVLADRGVLARNERLSEESCRPVSFPEQQSPEDSLLTMEIDGMDQAQSSKGHQTPRQKHDATTGPKSVGGLVSFLPPSSGNAEGSQPASQASDSASLLWVHRCPLQAKFRVPRNTVAAKDMSALWRPELHTVLCLIPGLLELYFLLDPGLKKDSNMEVHGSAYSRGVTATPLLLNGEK